MFDVPPDLNQNIIRAWKTRQESRSVDLGVRRMAEFLTAAAAAVLVFMWIGNPIPSRTAAVDEPDWEAVALVNHDSAEDGELRQVAQFMARDLSR